MSLAFLALILTITWIIYGTTKLRMNPLFVLLFAVFFLALLTGVPLASIPKVIGEGFGKTLGSIGLLIVFGTLIGAGLEASQATQTIAQFLLTHLSKLPLPFAVSCIGYVVSIPVFCDSAFVILSSLNKRLSTATKTPKIALTVALSTGLFAPHVLVPPTPGPLAAAANLSLNNLFLLLVYGGVFAFILALIGAFYAWYLAKKMPFEKETETLTEVPFTPQNLPKLFPSIAPILIPILLMGTGTFAALFSLPDGYLQFLSFISNPTVALGVGVILAFRLLPKKKVNEVVEKGMATAAPILIITALGGALGGVLQQLPLTDLLENTVGESQWGLLIPFLIAAILKTAQGSSTVAIITATSIVFPLLGVMGLDYEMGKVWVILAVGTGAMTVSHANDSYFWIVSQMGGIDVSTALKRHTFATFLQGGIGILLLLIAHRIATLI